ncbi:major facilitator superfamily protein [Stylonychia lemnae]|uniref:Major facilitator superfamily protein n=1 Tax=Stylonychia lemnae TaxID=5949 RepID=A0A078AE54_STYLE|nr:major facilitator superfamily protein [Stylonychia lemnae]|eukprot:CDW80475.1 major facilitator superfamily protein [Stylonychia lemnae]
MYTALNPTQNVYTQIMSSSNYDKLGFSCFALDSLFYGFGCLAASYIVNRIGVKLCLSISAIADTLWILAIIPPTLSSHNKTKDDMFITSDGFIYTTQISIQIFQGFCLGLKWVAESKYISECATEETKGFYFSLFWGIYMVSMVLGSLIAAFISVNFTQTTFLLIMAAIAALSIVIFATLLKPIPQERYLPPEDDYEIKEVETPEISKGDSFKAQATNKDFQAISQKDLSNGYAHINNSISVQNQTLRVTPISLKEEVKEVLLLIKSKKMLPLIPQLIWVGISVAIYSGILVIIIIDTESVGDDQYKVSQSMLTMVSFGAGEILGSLFSGWLIDKYGNKKTALFNIFLVLIQTGLTLVYLINYKYSWFSYVLTFVWGLQDSSTNTLSNEMLGFEFNNNSQSFSVSNFFQAMGGFIFNLIEGFIKGKQQYLIYTTTIGFLGILCNISTLFFKFKPMPQQLKQSMKQKNLIEEDQ